MKNKCFSLSFRGLLLAGVIGGICSVAVGREVTHLFTTDDFAQLQYVTDGEDPSPTKLFIPSIDIGGIRWRMEFDLNKTGTDQFYIPDITAVEDGSGVRFSKDSYKKYVETVRLTALDHQSCGIRSLVLDVEKANAGAAAPVALLNDKALESDVIPLEYISGGDYMYFPDSPRHSPLQIEATGFTDWGLYLRSLKLDIDDRRPVADPSFMVVARGSEFALPGYFMATDGNTPTSTDPIAVDGYTVVRVREIPAEDGERSPTDGTLEIHLYPLPVTSGLKTALRAFDSQMINDMTAEPEEAAATRGLTNYGVYDGGVKKFNLDFDGAGAIGTVNYQRLRGNESMTLTATQPGTKIACVEMMKPEDAAESDACQVSPAATIHNAIDRYVIIPGEATPTLKISLPAGEMLDTTGLRVHYSETTTAIDRLPSAPCNTAQSATTPTPGRYVDLTGRPVANPALPGLYVDPATRQLRHLPAR